MSLISSRTVTFSLPTEKDQMADNQIDVRSDLGHSRLS